MTVIRFIANKVNTGPVTKNGLKIVQLKRKGQPLEAGDLTEGMEYEFDRETGEIKENLKTK